MSSNFVVPKFESGLLAQSNNKTACNNKAPTRENRDGRSHSKECVIRDLERKEEHGNVEPDNLCELYRSKVEESPIQGEADRTKQK